MAESNKKVDIKEDKELADLLDSALQDFVTNDEKKETKSEEKKEDEVEINTNEWSDEFLQQATKHFDSNFMDLLNLSGQGDSSSMTDDKMKENFEQMAAAAQVFLNQDGGEMSSDFAATISQAVNDLRQGNDTNSFGESDPSSFVPPFMQGMMQKLLSKEVLYPSLKDVLDRFPEWLENNKEKLTNEDYLRYENQQKLMSDVCLVLENEKATDSKEVMDQRFDKVLNLMQKLQDYGQPPTDLVGDVGATPDLQNCGIM